MLTGDAKKHKTRNLVFNYISKHPGASFTTIQDVFELTEGTLRYHLQYLEKHHLLRSRLDGKHRCYFPLKGLSPGNGMSADFDVNALTGSQRRILAIIRDNPGIRMAKLEDMTNLDRRGIQYSIGKLRKLNLIWKVGNGRNTRYEYVTREKIQKEMITLLIHNFINGDIDEETYLRLRGDIERERMKKK